jgi:hypothetical protein
LPPSPDGLFEAIPIDDPLPSLVYQSPAKESPEQVKLLGCSQSAQSKVVDHEPFKKPMEALESLGIKKKINVKKRSTLIFFFIKTPYLVFKIGCFNFMNSWHP